MAETTQDTSMTISEKREAIMDLTGVSAETVMRLSPEQVGITYKKAKRMLGLLHVCMVASMYQIKKVKVKIRA